MSSTYTDFLHLEKPEVKSTAWDTILNNNFDTIDEGVRGSRWYGTAAGTILPYTLVGWKTSVADHEVQIAAFDGANTIDPIALCTVLTGYDGSAPLISRGWVENPSWSFTRGNFVYLSSYGAAGGELVDTAGINNFDEDGDQLLIFPVGIATSATRVFFDIPRFARRRNTVFKTGRMEVVSGSGTLSWIDGPGGAGKAKVAVYRFTGDASIVFPVVWPSDMGTLYNSSALWGFNVRYQSDGTDAVTGLAYHQSVEHVALSAGVGASLGWDDFAISMDEFYTADPSPGEEGYIELKVTASTQIDVEVFGRVRYIPNVLS